MVQLCNNLLRHCEKKTVDLGWEAKQWQVQQREQKAYMAYKV